MSKLNIAGKQISRNTLFIVLGSVLGLCVICVIIGSLLPDSSPSATTPPLDVTAVQQTALAMVYESSTQTAIANLPTITPIPPDPRP